MSYNDGGHGIDTPPEVPMRAVRELIANALVHRDLSATTDSKRVEIRLKDDLLVITSPGGLWGISEGQLGHPEGKSAVNSFLYEICKNVRLPDGTRVIEGEGGGIREAILATREAGLRPPRFTDYGGSFHRVAVTPHVVESGRPELVGDTSRRRRPQQRTASDPGRHAAWCPMDELFGENRLSPPVDSVEARRWLQQLVERGFAEAVGERGQTTYQLSPALRVPPTGAEATYLPIEAPPAEVVDLGPHTPTVWAALAQRERLPRLPHARGGCPSARFDTLSTGSVKKATLSRPPSPGAGGAPINGCLPHPRLRDDREYPPPRRMRTPDCASSLRSPSSAPTTPR